MKVDVRHVGFAMLLIALADLTLRLTGSSFGGWVSMAVLGVVGGIIALHAEGTAEIAPQDWD